MTNTVTVCVVCGAPYRDGKVEHKPLCANERYGWGWSMNLPVPSEDDLGTGYCDG
jgi:hypothetical protein